MDPTDELARGPADLDLSRLNELARKVLAYLAKHNSRRRHSIWTEAVPDAGIFELLDALKTLTDLGLVKCKRMMRVEGNRYTITGLGDAVAMLMS